MSRIFSAYSAGGLVGPALWRHPRGPRAFSRIRHSCRRGALCRLCSCERPPSRAHFLADRNALRLPGFWVRKRRDPLHGPGTAACVEGVLPLHLARRLDQTRDRADLRERLAAGREHRCDRPRAFPRDTTWIAAAGLVTIGLALAGATDTVGLWIVALVLTGTGIGLGNTGSIGMLLESVRPERIVTAMIIWSQIGIRRLPARPSRGRHDRPVARVHRARGLVPLGPRRWRSWQRCGGAPA